MSDPVESMKNSYIFLEVNIHNLLSLNPTLSILQEVYLERNQNKTHSKLMLFGTMTWHRRIIK